MLPDLLTHLPTLTVLLPGVGALLAAMLAYALPKGKLADALAMTITTAGVVLAAVGAWVLFVGLQQGWVAPSSTSWFTWLALPALVGSWQVEFGVLLDHLSATMLVVVTTVSACVHVYSVGYMHEDPSRRRFFIYLSAFTFAMLMLVSAPNLLQMFLGWEGVGVCSYLLIGFWHHKATANAAAIKAFLVNRVADAALLLGLFSILVVFGSLNYGDILPRVAELADDNGTALNAIALLIFIGAMGKSAQFGLHTWLPDAMEGPTPVSALIHAATMVTAGVFLLCRLSPLYEVTPDVLHIVGWVGAITALFAATVGLTQTDIKRVIAYSTCSQLGFMFFAIGVSAYPAAMFHLATHAAFKALLFLGAGSVIHGLHHEQNLFKMGSLRTALPITYGLMWLGSLALAGIPPFAGFFSKEPILESAFMAPDGTGWWLFAIGSVAAVLTAIYSFRVLFMAFNGKFQGDQHARDDAHEAPWVMLAPMLLLAVGAVFSGMALHGMLDVTWWQGALTINPAHHGLAEHHHAPLWVKLGPIVGAIGGITLAWYWFAEHRDIPHRLAKVWNIAYAISLNKWYVDELYAAVIGRPLAAIAKWLSTVGDAKLIDGAVNGAAGTVADFGQWLRQAQTGYVYHYAFAMLLAVVLGLGWALWLGLQMAAGGH